MHMEEYGISVKFMITNLQIQHQNLRNMSILHLCNFPISEGIDPAL